MSNRSDDYDPAAWRTPERVAELERYCQAVVRRRSPWLLKGPYRDQGVSDVRCGIAAGLAEYRPDGGTTVLSFCGVCAWRRTQTSGRSRRRWSTLRPIHRDRRVRRIRLMTDVDAYGQGPWDRPVDEVLAVDDPPGVGLEAAERAGHLRQMVAEAISTLSPRRRLVVRLRYGLDGGPPMSLRELAGLFRVSAEAVRQMLLKSEARLYFRLA